MINNFLCDTCEKQAVCLITSILQKFHQDSKKPLGVHITMDKCAHYAEDSADGE